MDSDKLVQVFDDQAIAYDKFRPTYPSVILDSYVELSGIKAGDSLLEFGCGTGQLTRDLLKRGFRVLSLEKGPTLARLARKNLGEYPLGKVLNCVFEDWESQSKFDGFLAAQAFHWVDKEEGINKVVDLLKIDRSLGLIWNVDVSQDTEFWKKSQPIYDTYFPSSGKKRGTVPAADAYEQYLSTRKDLSQVKRIECSWDKTFTKEAFLGLLSTFSNHMVLPTISREKFFEEIGVLIDSHGGQVQRFYKTVLLFSRKLLV